jgi:hypothetical protein
MKAINDLAILVWQKGRSVLIRTKEHGALMIVVLLYILMNMACNRNMVGK